MLRSLEGPFDLLLGSELRESPNIMAVFRSFVLALVISATVSDAFIFPPFGPWGAMAGAAAAVPVLLGGKLILIPKAIALKLGIGMLGASMSGAELLRNKLLVSGPLVGAAAGFRAATFLQDSQQAPNPSPVSVQNVYGGVQGVLPAGVQTAMPMQTIQPVQYVYPNYQASIRLPSLPVPSVQWYQQPINLNLPRVVFQQPENKFITISKQITTAGAPPPPPPVKPEEGETDTRTY